MKPITHLPVNWVNGLKLTSQHFFASQHSHAEALHREAERGLTDYNYGLGEPLEGIGENLELDIRGESPATLRVELRTCHAITRGGIPVIYCEGMYGDAVPCASLSGEELQAEDDYVVLVSVDPYTPVCVGCPDPEAVPLHHPHVLPALQLHILPRKQVNKAFYSRQFLLVAAITRQGSTYQIDRQYIPPVQRAACHEGIRTFTARFARTLRSILEDVKLIYSRNVAEKRRGTLGDNTFALCKAFSDFYGTRIFFVEQLAAGEPPIRLVQAVNELANGLHAALYRLSEVDREELLQYYYQWIDVTPSDFMGRLDAVLGLTYDHTDIGRSLAVAGDLLAMLSKMFRKMSELEYVGLSRENIVVGDESRDEAEAGKRRAWSFME